MRFWFVFGVGLVLASPAGAHAFAGGAAFGELLLAGATLPFDTPALILATLSLGLFVGHCETGGLPVSAAYLPFGVLVGLFLPRVISGDPVVALLIAGFALAALVAISPRISIYPARVLVAVAGGLIAFGCVTGHENNYVPVTAMFGAFIAIHIYVAAISAVFAITLEKLPYPATRIVLRIIASWTAAITILLGAFSFA